MLLAAQLGDIVLDVFAVRIPREMVRRLPEGRRGDAHLVKALVELAAGHGAPAAADRADTESQQRAVRELGATIAWGDVLARALALDEVLGRVSPPERENWRHLHG